MTLVKAGDTVDNVQVWLGVQDTVPLQATEDVVVTVPRQGAADMRVTMVYDGPVPAPIHKGDRIATLTASAPGIPAVEHPLVAGADVAERGFFGRAFAGLGSLIGRALN